MKLTNFFVVYVNLQLNDTEKRRMRLQVQKLMKRHRMFSCNFIYCILQRMYRPLTLLNAIYLQYALDGSNAEEMICPFSPLSFSLRFLLLFLTDLHSLLRVCVYSD